jgi:hypothetical protein
LKEIFPAVNFNDGTKRTFEFPADLGHTHGRHLPRDVLYAGFHQLVCQSISNLPHHFWSDLFGLWFVQRMASMAE